MEHPTRTKRSSRRTAPSAATSVFPNLGSFRHFRSEPAPGTPGGTAEPPKHLTAPANLGSFRQNPQIPRCRAVSRSSTSNIAENSCTIPHNQGLSFTALRLGVMRSLGPSGFVPRNPAACHPENQMSSATWDAFQRALTRWEREKIHPATALRNTAGVVIPRNACATGQR
jgi:hypothetical protein